MIVSNYSTLQEAESLITLIRKSHVRRLCDARSISALKCSENQAALHEANTCPYFLLFSSSKHQSACLLTEYMYCNTSLSKLELIEKPSYNARGKEI